MYLVASRLNLPITNLEWRDLMEGVRMRISVIILVLLTLMACRDNPNAIAPSDAAALLAEASDKVAAGKFSYQSRSIYVVEIDGGESERTDSSADTYYDPGKGWFSDIIETSNFESLPKRNRIVKIGDKGYILTDARDCYVEQPGIGDNDNPFGFFTLDELLSEEDSISSERTSENGNPTEKITIELLEDAVMIFTIQNGLLIEKTTSFGDLDFDFEGVASDDFKGKIGFGSKTTARIYDIGIEKELPSPEPICP